MSHVAVYHSTLGIVNVDILKKALEVIAKEEGIEVGDSVQDYYGHAQTSHNRLKIIGALSPSGLPRGIGVAVDKNGKLQFIGDSYGDNSAFKKMQERIEQTYQDVVLILAAQQMGYEVNVEKSKSGILRIEGSQGG